MSFEQITREAGRLFDVHPRDIKGPSHYKFIIPARFALYLALVRRGNSQANVGRVLNRDHKTVAHGCRRAENREARDAGYASKIRFLVRYEPEKYCCASEQQSTEG